MWKKIHRNRIRVGYVGGECKNMSLRPQKSGSFVYSSIKCGPELVFLLFFCCWRTKETQALSWPPDQARPCCLPLYSKVIADIIDNETHSQHLISNSVISFSFQRADRGRVLPPLSGRSKLVGFARQRVAFLLQSLSVTYTNISNLLIQGGSCMPEQVVQPFPFTGLQYHYQACDSPFKMSTLQEEQDFCPLGQKVHFLQCMTDQYFPKTI